VQPSQILNRHYAFVLAAIAIGCSAPDSVNSPTALTGLQLDAARPTDPGYTVVELPTFAGDRESFAVDVNDAGTVVGYGIGSTFPRGFVLTATSSTPIPLGDATSWSRGLAISSGSNGSPLYVVGDYASITENSHATRWTVDAVAGTAIATTLSTEIGYANGVNDGGKAVGSSGSDAVIWALDGTVMTIVPPEATFTNGVGRDINNADHSVFNFSGPSYTRTYFRNADGRMIELPPLSGDVSTYGRRVSEVSGNTVYVAGTSFLNDNSFHAMRWTIDVTSNSIITTENRSETSSSSDVSTGGSMSGSLTGRQKSTPFLWRLTGLLLTLNPPKGGGSADASGISDNGKYLVGQAFIRQHRRAVLWTFSTP
jgi:uncharacterized membrane protein